MQLENHERFQHDYHTSTNSRECSGGPEDKERNQIQNQSLDIIISPDQNSNPEKISCKLPIILEKELIHKPYNFNADLTLFELIIKGLKKQRTHCISDLDEFLTNDPSKKLVLDSMEAFCKARMQPNFPSKLRTVSMVTSTNKRKEYQVATCTSTNSSTSSYPPSSSRSNSSICTGTGTGIGLLHRFWHNGLPHFKFSIEGPDGMLVANPIKVRSDRDSALDYIYLFHEGGNAKKESTSRFLGNMRVSSRYILNPNGSDSIETEFVLFGSKEDYDRDMQNPSSSLVKNKGLISKVAEMLKPSLSPLQRHTHKTSKPILCETSPMEGEVSGNKQLGSTNSTISEDFQTNRELATIIITDSEISIMKKEPVIGGWGLKFLHKNETMKHNSSKRKINVLVPRGFHGGPVGPIAGPDSLRKRWSGGVCDCGGWDLGCPITVFSNGNRSDGSPHGEAQEDGSEDLFIEGVRHSEPALKLVNMSENVFLVHFQSDLSSLQCFSIAVAIVHTRTPDLYPKL